MKKIVSRGACLLLASCLSLNAVGCQKSNENNKIIIRCFIYSQIIGE